MLRKYSQFLLNSAFLSSVSKRNFPRGSAQPIPTMEGLKQQYKLIQQQKEKEFEEQERSRVMRRDPELRRQEQQSREQLYDYHFEEYQASRLSLGVMDIPEEVQKRAQKVFSKFQSTQVRKWAYQLTRHYQSLHACQKPVDMSLLVGKPRFMNTIDMKTHFQSLKFQYQDTGRLDGIEKQLLKNQQTNPEEIQINKPTSQQSKMDNIISDSQEAVKLKYDRAHAVGYLLKKMPQTYLVNARIFHQIASRMPGFEPTSLLDYGAGLGSAAWSGMREFQTIKKVAAVEPNANMRKLGRHLTSDIEPQILWTEALSMIPGTGTERGKFDIAVISHVLQEVATPKARQIILEALWQRVHDNGILIVIEPGSPKGFRFIHDVREWFLNTYERQEASIVAPCPHHLDCPMGGPARKWCHYSQLMNRYRTSVFPRKQKSRQYQNQKFSFLVLKKGPTPNIQFEAEREAPTAQDKSFFWPRVILPVIRKHRHSIVDLCTPQGKLQRRIVAKSHSAFGGYRSIKKIKWGDLWHVPKQIPHRFRKETKKGKRLW